LSAPVGSYPVSKRTTPTTIQPTGTGRIHDLGLGSKTKVAVNSQVYTDLEHCFGFKLGVLM